MMHTREENSVKPLYQKLLKHAKRFTRESFRALVSSDPTRFDRYCIESPIVDFDYSRQLIDEEALSCLMEYAHFRQLTVLQERLPEFAPQVAYRQKLINAVTLEPFLQFADAFARNFPHIKHWVHLGIGGSYLGPKLLNEVLACGENTTALTIHFVANVDKAALENVLQQVSPQETAFCVVSKSFTTEETLCNAETARKWLEESHVNTAKHFFAITSEVAKAAAFDIPLSHIFCIPEGLPGRFSLWSAVGLPLALKGGVAAFTTLLKGAVEVDEQVMNQPILENIAMMAALLQFWNASCLFIPVKAVLPYSHALQSFPQYIQQLEMESNGKILSSSHKALLYPTQPIVFGEAGCLGQHAFHQLIHQGSHHFALDFMVFAERNNSFQERSHQTVLLADAFSQLEAATIGTPDVSIDHPHYLIGGHPSSVWVAGKLSTYTLGGLLALYEHQVLFSARLWDLYPFDQPGIEAGKALSKTWQRALLATPVETDCVGRQKLVERITRRKDW